MDKKAKFTQKQEQEKLFDYIKNIIFNNAIEKFDLFV